MPFVRILLNINVYVFCFNDSRHLAADDRCEARGAASLELDTDK